MKRIYQKLLLIGAAIAMPLVGMAQDLNISGTVLDGSGDPVVGASVVVKGTTIGVTTGINGDYNIAAPSDATLTFSFLGMETKEEAVDGRGRVDVVMGSSEQALEEVVVVGYGVQKKANLTGSVASIDAQDLQSRPIQNLSQALQGLAAGVSVQSGEGRPGQDGATIRMRGIGTLNTGYAGPYILIDGVEAGTMNSLDPNDVETISFLKDAASAAIYGSKAANGVILITTKRGKAGQAPKVTYTGQAGIQRPTNMIERLSSYDYATLYNAAAALEGAELRFSEEDLRKFQDGSDPYGHPNTDWYALAFKLGYQHSHNASVTGGTENVKYMASAGYLAQDAILPNSTREQFNARANIDVKLGDRVSVRSNLAFINNDYKDPDASYAGGSSDQIIRQLNIIAPWIPNRNADGTYGTYSDGNPIAWLDLNQTVDRYNQNFTGMLAADIKIVQGLLATISGSYVTNTQHYKNFRKFIQYNPSKASDPNRLDERYYLWNRPTLDITLNYDKQWGSHNLHALAGWHTEQYNYSENTMVRRNFPNNELTDMNAGASSTQTNSGYTRQLAMVSGFGRINYDYAGKYLAEVNIRADASSRFAPEHRWGYFPSFSAGWRMSEEPFMQNARRIVDNLKVRASWGLLGDQAAAGDYYPYINTYNLGGSYPFDGILQTGYYQSSYKIETFSWEKSRVWGFGIDVGLLNSVSLTIDYYDRKTTDIIMDVPVPSEFGMGAYKDNVGSVSNKGVEAALQYHKRWGEWTFGASGMLAYNKNEILDLGAGVTQMIDGNTIRRVGNKINAYYVYKTDGLFQSQEEVDAYTAKYNRENGTTMFGRAFKPGDIRYVDVNGDGKINADDRVLCNSATPDYTFGLTLSAAWKGIDVSMMFAGAAGVAHIYSWEVFGRFSGDNSHPSTWWQNTWTPTNKNNEVPRLWTATNSNSDPQNIMSDFWVMNTSYVRMKNLQVGYTFPAAWTKLVKIDRARIFYSAENLFTLDALPINLDPETTSERASSYPLIQTHSIGLTLTF
jgi:TonB-linked SusC/RagA family outer membrane protein